MTGRFSSAVSRGILLIFIGSSQSDAQDPILNTTPVKSSSTGVSALQRKEAERVRESKEVRLAKIRDIGKSLDEIVVVMDSISPEDRLKQRQAIALQERQFSNAASRRKLLKLHLDRMRPLLKVEYRYMRSICEPSKAERKSIAHAGELAHRVAVGNYVDFLLEQPQNQAPVNCRKIIQDGLRSAVKATLSAEVSQRYEEELTARDQEHKTNAIMRLVTKMDSILLLTNQQRQRITEVLLGQWDSHLNLSPAVYNLEYASFPLFSEQDFLPILSDAQKRIWQGAQRVSMGSNPTQYAGAVEPGPLDDEFPDEVIEIPEATPWLPTDGGKPDVKLLDALTRPGVKKR